MTTWQFGHKIGARYLESGEEQNYDLCFRSVLLHGWHTRVLGSQLSCTYLGIYVPMRQTRGHAWNLNRPD